MCHDDNNLIVRAANQIRLEYEENLMSKYNLDVIDEGLPITDPFEAEEFHGSARTETESAVVAYLYNVHIGFIAAQEGWLEVFRLPTVFLDGLNGVVVYKSSLRQFAGDVVEGDVLLLIAKRAPIDASAFFFLEARSVSKE